MFDGIGQNELNRRCGIAMQFVIYAIDIMFGIGKLLRWDSRSYGAMAKEELLCITSQRTEIIADRFVAAMNGRIERRVMDIYPIVLAFLV